MRDFNGTNEDLRNVNSVAGIDVDAMTMFVSFELDTLASSQQVITTAAAQGAGQSGLSLNYVTSANVFRLNYRFSTTSGVWDLTGITPATGTVYRLAVKYDRSSVSNDPEVFLDGVKLTVGSGLTETTTPVGTAFTGIDSVFVGTNANLGQDLNGRVGEPAMWSAELVDARMEAMSNGFAPEWYDTDREFYWKLLGSRLRDEDQGAVLTATGTTVVGHPRVIYPGPAIIVPEVPLSTGTASVSTPPPTLDAAGAVDVDGTASVTTPAPALASTGAVDVDGSATVATPSPALASTGAVDVDGTASVTTPPPALASTGAVDVDGAASVATPPPALASTGAVDVVGSATVATPPPALASTAAVDVDGTASVSTPPPALASTGDVDVDGTATVTTPPPALASTGAVDVSGTASVDTPSPALASTGAVDIDGTAAVSTPPPALTAVGSPVAGGTASVATPPPALVSAGAVDVDGSASVATPPPALVGVGAVDVVGTATLTLAAVELFAVQSPPIEFVDPRNIFNPQGRPTVLSSGLRNTTLSVGSRPTVIAPE